MQTPVDSQQPKTTHIFDEDGDCEACGMNRDRCEPAQIRTVLGGVVETKTDEEIAHAFAVNISNIGLLDSDRPFIELAAKDILSAIHEARAAAGTKIEVRPLERGGQNE